MWTLTIDQDNADISAAKTAIEGVFTSVSDTQANIADETAAKTVVESIIDRLELEEIRTMYGKSGAVHSNGTVKMNGAAGAA